jgi:hypothetical protein
MSDGLKPENSKFTCPICHQPVELNRDCYADENGKIVPEECYMQRLISSQNDPPGPQGPFPRIRAIPT